MSDEHAFKGQIERARDALLIAIQSEFSIDETDRDSVCAVITNVLKTLKVPDKRKRS